ncbi:hypothetical protein ASD65_11585 [Microbacterium sp. Root61]|uniref:hypothetical protein n=1 Tax=Microbacterium sp. Root61 TaxID=1736570 RepID=UPI0006F4DED9|nr:hypothetical protein [Microbacterium sp. Root61]KRA24995.1 hypothetical protein ASD65_11585 [Microbacterium sp. Root61]
MTVRNALGAVGRRCYVLIAVLLVFGFLTYSFYRDGGSFFTHTTVTFTLPMRSTLMQGSGTTDESLIAFAGAVATEINGGKPVASYSTSDAPSYGAGLREGVWVGLRNDGNQWMAIFPSATIDIRIVGRTREQVAQQQRTILGKIMAVADGQQHTAASSPEEQITATVGPLSTEISEVSATRSAQVMAIAAMALAGLIVGIPASVAVDRLIRRYRRRSRRRLVARRSIAAHQGGTLA